MVDLEQAGESRHRASEQPVLEHSLSPHTLQGEADMRKTIAAHPDLAAQVLQGDSDKPGKGT